MKQKQASDFQPYKFDAMKALMQKAFRMGWYVGKHDLLKVTMKGAFEGFSRRATETWEQRFFVEFKKPAGDNPETHPEKVYIAEGETLEEACQKILLQIQEDATA